MIRYSLRCEHDHAFESWFQDSSAYDTQVKRKLVSCPVCGSHVVAKTRRGAQHLECAADRSHDVSSLVAPEPSEALSS